MPILKRIAARRRASAPGIIVLNKARLAAMIANATVDAGNEAEQALGLYTMLEERLALPFETTILGVKAMVESLDLGARDQVVAICRRGLHRQRVPVADLPLPTPAPEGSEWIEAYREWIGSR